jgi:hypothetical protein
MPAVAIQVTWAPSNTIAVNELFRYLAAISVVIAVLWAGHASTSEDSLGRRNLAPPA